MKNCVLVLILLSLVFSCSVSKKFESEINQNKIQQNKKNNLDKTTAMNTSNSKNQIATFLTFQDNNAENAMNFYVDLFDNSKIINVNRWGEEGPGKEGTIMHATFDLNGNLFMCSDSPAIHEWGFTPAVSNFVECENESELERMFGKLSENGKVMMPLNNYGFSKKFGFVEDQFGVSWQLNLQ